MAFPIRDYPSYRRATDYAIFLTLMRGPARMRPVPEGTDGLFERTGASRAHPLRNAATLMIFWTTLLIVHGLLAVALLGAVTHQAVALWWPVRAPAGSFVTRFRAVPSLSYVRAIIVLYVVTFIMGAWIYTNYRYTSRLALEQLRFFKTVGAFEIKEHIATIGLIVLPAYWA